MTSTPSEPIQGRWTCCQLGAREHYAIPRVIHRQGALEALYTDFWAPSLLRAAARALPAARLRSLAARHHPDLDHAPVRPLNSHALAWNRRLPPGANRYRGYVEVGRQFSCAVRDSLQRRADVGRNTVLFAYDTGGLEAMAWCRDMGIPCVLGQVDPGRAEVERVQEEERRWPGWTTQSLSVPEDYFQRRAQEWALADRVVVNSGFSRAALLRQGVPEEKIVVIPLCYEPESRASQPAASVEQRGNGPLRVLFLGQVILRKGIQYLVEAARKLSRENIRFDVVGPLGIAAEALEAAPDRMRFHGAVPRTEAGRWYGEADVFVLPTLSDGFALTQLEAMAHGLPVVTTPCCGEVVRDGEDGFVVPAADANALAEAIRRYVSEPGLLARQRPAAVERSSQFSLERLGREWGRLSATLVNRQPGIGHV